MTTYAKIICIKKMIGGHTMAKKELMDALKSFDEKYFAVCISPDKSQQFGALLNQYVNTMLDAGAAGESEEHTKKIINTFLEQSFYQDASFSVNTAGNVDSSIRYNKKLLALIEVKRVNSKPEMPTVENINKKALWELVLYYLGETRNVSKKTVTRNTDSEIRRLIITDGLKWIPY